MLHTTIYYGLLVLLAIGLLFAAVTDLQHRRIDNWLNLAIALAAPLFWWANDLSLWPQVAMQLGVAAGTFALLAALFAAGWMGGGDVKLLTALALWIAPPLFLDLVIMMALLGGVLTIGFAAWHLTRRRSERLAVPYGVAIALAGLWVLGTGYLPDASAGGLG